MISNFKRIYKFDTPPYLYPIDAITMLRSNQQKAIDLSVSNDFSSGVHFHATGTGKSWIALQLLSTFHQLHPHTNIMWICEQKSILIEQFHKDTISSKGFSNVLQQFLILNYTVDKPLNWPSIVNSCQIWKKPILLIINRAFLTSCQRYMQLKIPFDLILHDECHSISNQTTRNFYKHMMQTQPSIRCIGFSATPILEYEPFTKILSSYTIYDGVQDDIIVPPKIMWMKSNSTITQEKIRMIVPSLLSMLPYQKIIVWCGMIDMCYQMAKEWKQDLHFQDWLIAVDTSKQDDEESSFATYEQFRMCPEKGLLFCASKHREGSDIPNIDGCLFLDQVEERNAKTFVQCMGRVLRRDPLGKKKFGLVIDINAWSSIKLCDRMNKYIHNSRSDFFPFYYTFQRQEEYELHTLDMVVSSSLTKEIATVYHTPHELIPYFKRPFPTQKKYIDRLRMELEMIASKQLNGYLLQAIEILKITEGIPHVTRGSCGSSLVCYLLGISHVDPIRWNIHFARFLTTFRSTLPDIDFDFPHTMRDEVFLQIHMKWPGKIARISNHVYFHKKSALREAIRRSGYRTRIGSLELYRVIQSMSHTQRKFVYSETKKIENTFRTYSLHCGGIVYYPSGIPPNLQLQSKKSPIMSQIILNKQDIARDKHFKIDILSSRAITQLYEANHFLSIDFEASMEDKATIELFQRGDNIGITLAESPLIRKAFMKLKPKSVEEIAQCLAIIRPAARDARVAETTKDLDTVFVYDDDAIDMIAKTIQCTYEEADYYRRAMIKGDSSILRTFMEQCRYKKVDTKPLFKLLRNIRKYSFCKSHAYSYAQLVWQLAYQKANHPEAFWKATLKHCQSSYRKWVHLYEAQRAGITSFDDLSSSSIYALARNKKERGSTPLERMYCTGYWHPTETEFFPNCYLHPMQPNTVVLRGLIAHSRILSYYTKIKKAVLFVGYAPSCYIEVIVSGKILPFRGKIGIQCEATVIESGVYQATEKTVQFW